MKNIFKMFSIALVAGAMMFASCGKEDDTAGENNGGNGNGGNTDPTTITAGIKASNANGTLSFEIEGIVSDTVIAYTMGYTDGYWSRLEDSILFRARGYYMTDEEGALYFPRFQQWFQYSADKGWSTFGLTYLWNSDKAQALANAFKQQDPNYTDNYYQDWEVTEWKSFEIESFDADNYTLTATVAAVFYDVYDYVIGGNDNCEEANISVSYNNFKFIEATKNGGFTEKPAVIR